MSETKTCFVLMPFTVKDIDKVKYHNPNHWNEVYEGLILPAAGLAELSCSREDGDVGSRLIVDSILHNIENADLIVCDLSSHNPNVFLELGWVLRSDKPYLLIKDDLTTFTFDLNQQFTFEYDHYLQPTVLKKNITDLKRAMVETLMDTSRRFSVVARIALGVSAIKSASAGDKQMQMLLNIQRMLQPYASRFQTSSISQDEFPWPELLRRAMNVLEQTRQELEKTPNSYYEIKQQLQNIVQKLGLNHRLEIQMSVIDSNRTFIYHDWEQMIGMKARYSGLDSQDIYDDIFKYPAGAIAWTDRTTNISRPMFQNFLRYNIAIFCSVQGGEKRLVVELHHEVC